MADDEESIVPEEFSNLILDDTPITEITADDKEYLHKFVNLEKLAMNATGLKNLNNLPENLKIVRVSNLFTAFYQHFLTLLFEFFSSSLVTTRYKETSLPS